MLFKYRSRMLESNAPWLDDSIANQFCSMETYKEEK